MQFGQNRNWNSKFDEILQALDLVVSCFYLSAQIPALLAAYTANTSRHARSKTYRQILLLNVKNILLNIKVYSLRRILYLLYCNPIYRVTIFYRVICLYGRDIFIPSQVYMKMLQGMRSVKGSFVSCESVPIFFLVKCMWNGGFLCCEMWFTLQSLAVIVDSNCPWNEN